MKTAIKKEIRKQVKINDSHLGTVSQALRIQFPSVNVNDWKEFIESEFQKKYNSIESTTKARF